MYIPLLQSLGTSHPAGSRAASDSSSSSTSDPTGGLNTMFLQLLTAQLKAQSPIDPLDPNQFVAQLAQFQSLSALTDIDQNIQTMLTDIASASGRTTQSAVATSFPTAISNSSSL